MPFLRVAALVVAHAALCMCRDDYQEPGTLFGPPVDQNEVEDHPTKTTVTATVVLPCPRPVHTNAGAGEVRPGPRIFLRRHTNNVKCDEPPATTDHAHKNFNRSNNPTTDGHLLKVRELSCNQQRRTCPGRSLQRDPRRTKYKSKSTYHRETTRWCSKANHCAPPRVKPRPIRAQTREGSGVPTLRTARSGKNFQGCSDKS
jgi:hypothetical protein